LDAFAELLDVLVSSIDSHRLMPLWNERLRHMSSAAWRAMCAEDDLV
jgi:hypothetical protein